MKSLLTWTDDTEPFMKCLMTWTTMHNLMKCLLTRTDPQEKTFIDRLHTTSHKVHRLCTTSHEVLTDYSHSHEVLYDKERD